jgi:hypothetical protein
MKITKRQLKRIIREEKQQRIDESAGALPLVGIKPLSRDYASSRPSTRLSRLNEGVYIPDLLSSAADALQNRDADTLESLAASLNGLMISDDEMTAYAHVLEAMTEAAYELQNYENVDYEDY